MGSGETAMEHGGDLHDAKARFPEAPEPWLDLSTGINPTSYPAGPLDGEIFRRLPSPGEVRIVERIAARAYGVADPDRLVAAAGSQALIALLPRLRAKGRVAIVGPTFEEHAHQWARQGHKVVSVPDPEAALAARADVIVVVNPNNPDGRIVPAERMAETAASLRARDGWLVADEAFADLETRISIASLDLPNAIVLRSVGKAYGLAGLRLGFAVAWPALARELRQGLGPWAVSGPALAVGAQALADEAWLAAQGALLRDAAGRLDTLLAKAGFWVEGGTSLFRLARHEATALRFEQLARAGIWVRAFSWDSTLLRFGIPQEKDWPRLEKALIY
ncbi:threonine-phosphate decarboxylase [Microvirga sp. 17 mud 1-3]|nr:threonine-phosphate decarboxylase [Microvirga sp. 17 mud 1-3]